MKLYDYFRSSAAYRVRIALNLKGISYQNVPVHLVRGGGEQRSAAYAALNPQMLVPTLVDGKRVLTQSLAICEYLEETHRAPPLLPADPPGRARVRALAQSIACEIHPLNNLRVLDYLRGTLGIDEAAVRRWYGRWVEEGFRALERLLCRDRPAGRFCHGETPGLADLCLVPQVYNARRYAVDLDPYPTIVGIDAACAELAAFAAARPELQPDAEG